MGHPATIGFGFSSTAEAMGHPGFSSTAEAMGHPGFSPTAEAMGHPLQVMRSRGLFRPAASRWLLSIAVLVLGILGMGCSTAQRVDVAAPSGERVAEPVAYADTAWITVLRENVKAGLVDYRHLVEHRAPLDTYLAMLARFGPASTPDQFAAPDAALAYYVNAHNACVLVAVIRAGVPVTMYDLTLPSLETGYRFEVDGAPCTLGELRDLARAQARDARVEFAFCAAARGAPQLAREPYRAFDVRARMQRLAARAMSDPRLVRIDHEKGKLLIGVPIWSRREDFLATYRRETGSASATVLNCLMHLAAGPRREYLVRATGYPQQVMPFDRTLDAWKPNREQ
jgi:hypothetical protein